MAVQPGGFGLWEYWDWVREESVRVAEILLFELPYSPEIVLSEPPSEEGFKFARFAVVDALPLGKLRGRPFGSGLFQTREDFVMRVRYAFHELRATGRNPTSRDVADLLARKGVLSLADPARQLRRSSREFGFRDWNELISAL